MNSRERVIATLQHKKTDRVPRDLWALPYISLFRKDELDQLLDKFELDFVYATNNPLGVHENIEKFREPVKYYDEWGSLWEAKESGIIGEVIKPALDTYDKLSDYEAPYNLLKNIDVEEVNNLCKNTDKFVLSPVTARPFERLQFIRGTENTFLDFMMEPENQEKLIRKIHKYYIEEITMWCKTDVDAVFIMDDWGSQNTLLIDPLLWREIFKPLYKEYCDIIHNYRKYVFMHSDGHIAAIMDDLIEVGVDAINSQLFSMDIEENAKKYKGKITFWGEIDRQHVLPFGNESDVEEAVKRVRKSLDSNDGGVIAQFEWGKDISFENSKKVFDSWL